MWPFPRFRNSMGGGCGPLPQTSWPRLLAVRVAAKRMAPLVSPAMCVLWKTAWRGRSWITVLPRCKSCNGATTRCNLAVSTHLSVALRPRPITMCWCAPARLTTSWRSNRWQNPPKSQPAALMGRPCACFGTCAACPTSGASAIRSTRTSWTRSSAICMNAGRSPTTGWPARSSALTAPMGILMPSANAWHLSAHGPMWRSAKVGWTR
mmetsp:Transcript_27337/g.50119  ORF Transcript_27337/g.50119 Transcript_27337/m.50119 type:complete len:208 (+) Transcript_27337:1304-1927(+)